MTLSAHPGAPKDRNVEALVASASRWIRRSVEAWAEGDHESVNMLAPVAVEHLGKAALWKRHPALLVPLSNNAEASLHILIERPDLNDARLRTIGLTEVLRRLRRCVGSLPLSDEEARVLVDTRNGSVHVGAKGRSQNVLRDALTLMAALLDDLSITPEWFYRDQVADVQGILDAQRSEMEADVAAKRARARKNLEGLEEKLGSLYGETLHRLEAEGRLIDGTESFVLPDGVAIDRVCPECGYEGRLIGWLDADPDVDWDVEKIGNAYEPYVAGTAWHLMLGPVSFRCNVCQLSLDGHGQLAAAGLPTDEFAIRESDLDDDFDVNQHYQTFMGDEED